MHHGCRKLFEPSFKAEMILITIYGLILSI